MNAINTKASTNAVDTIYNDLIERRDRLDALKEVVHSLENTLRWVCDVRQDDETGDEFYVIPSKEDMPYSYYQYEYTKMALDFLLKEAKKM